MDEATAKLLAEKAAGIAKETAEKLKLFTRETATLLYAKQMLDNEVNLTSNFAEGTEHKKEHKKMDNKEANQKVNKMLDDAKMKWKYADEPAKKQVTHMEKIILEGEAKIKAVYAGVVAAAEAINKRK